MLGWRSGTGPALRELNRLLRTMDDLCDSMSGPRKPWMVPLWQGAQLFPLLNVRESAHSYIVTAELPGIKTDDLDIKIEGDTLTMRGERRPKELGDGARYHRHERTTGAFRRSLVLPGKVDVEHVEATYKDGVLTITLPKEKTGLPGQMPGSPE